MTSILELTEVLWTREGWGRKKWGSCGKFWSQTTIWFVLDFCKVLWIVGVGLKERWQDANKVVPIETGHRKVCSSLGYATQDGRVSGFLSPLSISTPTAVSMGGNCGVVLNTFKAHCCLYFWSEPYLALWRMQNCGKKAPSPLSPPRGQADTQPTLPIYVLCSSLIGGIFFLFKVICWQ